MPEHPSTTPPHPSTRSSAACAWLRLPHQSLANQPKLASPLRGGLWVGHVQLVERADENLRDDQACVLLVVGGHDVPGCLLRARRAQALLVRFSVPPPELPLLGVR